MAAARRAREAVGRQRAEDAVRQMDKLANPTLQEHVSKMFSFGGKESSKTMCALSFGRDGEAVGVDRRRQQGRFRHRALASHVAGVRKGLLVHCRNCDVLVCSEVADDATMWTRLPEDGTGDAARAQRASRKRLRSKSTAAAGGGGKRGLAKQASSGRNLATTCLSVVQHVMAVRAATGSVQTAQIHGPTRALPEANWSTVHDRKRRWSVWTGSGVGAVFLMLRGS